jgi:hypothetical protein
MDIKVYNPRDWKSHPPYTFAGYGSSKKRGPLKRLVPIEQTLSEITGPLFSDIKLEAGETDLTRNADSGKEAMGERIIVVGYQCLAARPYSSLVVWPQLCDPPRDAVLFPGRSVDSSRSDFQFSANKKRPPAIDGELRSRCDGTRVRFGLSFRHRVAG